MVNEELAIPAAPQGTATVRQGICDAAIKIREVLSQPWQLHDSHVAGSVNVQGETTHALDLFANQQFMQHLSRPGGCAGIASEELENFIAFDNETSQASPYVCLYDPLDGSANINVHISVGSIFAVCRRISPIGGPVAKADFLQPGHRQVAAGYILYGTSTFLVYSTGAGVNGFTLDPATSEFRLTHPGIRCPGRGNTHAINYGYFSQFSPQLQSYVKRLQHGTASPGIISTQRYTGSMVADMHRCLLEGGVFMYPSTTHQPAGKLRLQYECNPMAFITEAAGGRATDGKSRILDILPTALHQRTPFIAGSKEMVNEFLASLRLV